MPSVFERNPTLAEIVRTKQAIDSMGAPFQVHSEVSPHFAEALYRSVLAWKPTLAVEIGMAVGVSTLSMLTAMSENQRGKLISIDPFQSTFWKGSGSQSVHRAGCSQHHELIEQPSYLALPGLVASGTRIDFAYIDGVHTFDYVLIDFFHIDRMLRVGGVVAFNDCSFPAVHKALLYLVSHRRYDEIQVGLQATPAWESRRTRLLRSLGLSGLSEAQRTMRPVAEDRYFRKREEWEPESGYFQEF